MYLDDLPELTQAKRLRAGARGVAIRDGDRAVAVAFVAGGSLLPSGTLVRFDVTRGEDPSRRLADALTATGARAIWFYGGDEATRRAALGLDLVLQPVGAAFVRRMDARAKGRVVFRAPSPADRVALTDVLREAPGFRAPHVQVAEIDREPVGVVLSEALEGQWSETCAVVYEAHRGRGYGAALLAGAADRLESGGRRVCAAIEGVGGAARTTLERAGFRLADYYFTATRRS